MIYYEKIGKINFQTKSKNIDFQEMNLKLRKQWWDPLKGSVVKVLQMWIAY